MRGPVTTAPGEPLNPPPIAFWAAGVERAGRQPVDARAEARRPDYRRDAGGSEVERLGAANVMEARSRLVRGLGLRGRAEGAATRLRALLPRRAEKRRGLVREAN